MLQYNTGHALIAVVSASIGLLLHDIFVSLSDLRHLAVFLCETTLLCCSEAGNAVLLKRNKTSLRCFLKERVDMCGGRESGGCIEVGGRRELLTRTEANANSGPNMQL